MPLNVRLPPLQFKTLSCNASAFASCSVPLVIVVAPVNVFAPESASWPVPFCFNAPVPEIIPDKVCEAVLS